MERQDPEAKKNARDRLKHEVIRTRVGKRIERTLNRINAEKILAKREGKPYKGPSPWIVKRNSFRMIHAALARDRIESSRKERTLLPNKKQDERAANDEAWKTYRRNNQGWQAPAEKPPQLKRKPRCAAAPGRKQLQKARKRLLNPATVSKSLTYSFEADSKNQTRQRQSFTVFQYGHLTPKTGMPISHRRC